LRGPSDVVVRGATIESVIPTAAESVPAGPDARVIDGGGRVLMPGLIDAHWHATFVAVSAGVALTADPGYLHLMAGREAQRTLLRGFTSVPDAGGPSFALKRAIDEGAIAGPRIYPSGAFITQTAGHGDFRMRHEVPRACGTLSHGEVTGASTIADGVDQVLRAAREQLLLGASQLKVMAGGGIASPYDPIDVTQYTEAELRAAVEAAEDWGTYVMVHAYTPRAISRSIRAGVRCIEHGHLADDPTAQLLAETETWWSLQPFLDDEDAYQPPRPGRPGQAAPGHRRHRPLLCARPQARRQGRLGVRHSVRRLPGRPPGPAAGQDDPLVYPGRGARLGDIGERRAARPLRTRNPYPGRLGVVEPGALADLLLVDGDPIANIDLLADPDRSLLVIMKDGRIHKDSAPAKD
jgi:imidazolonepropionase-like amidohydrolase